MKKSMCMGLATLMCAATLLAGCDSGIDKQTYKGTLSETPYISVERACNMLLSEEFPHVDTWFQSYEKKGNLSAKDIEALDLDIEVISGERGVVHYLVDEETARTQEIYLLGIAGGYYYYAPTPKKGELVPQKYLKNLADGEKYTNCTMEGKGKIAMTVFHDGISVNVNTNLEVSFTITEDVILTSFKLSSDSDEESVKEEIFCYVREDEGYTKYELSDGEWSFYGFSHLGVQEIVSENFFGIDEMSFIYEKTKKGFKLAPEGKERYVSSYLTELGALVSVGISSKADYDVDFSLNYTVENAHLAAEKMSMKGKIVDKTTTLNVDVSSTATYSKFGTTKAEIPDALKAYIESSHEWL